MGGVGYWFQSQVGTNIEKMTGIRRDFFAEHCRVALFHGTVFLAMTCERKYACFVLPWNIGCLNP